MNNFGELRGGWILSIFTIPTMNDESERDHSLKFFPDFSHPSVHISSVFRCKLKMSNEEWNYTDSQEILFVFSLAAVSIHEEITNENQIIVQKCINKLAKSSSIVRVLRVTRLPRWESRL